MSIMDELKKLTRPYDDDSALIDDDDVDLDVDADEPSYARPTTVTPNAAPDPVMGMGGTAGMGSVGSMNAGMGTSMGGGLGVNDIPRTFLTPIEIWDRFPIIPNTAWYWSNPRSLMRLP